MPELDFPPFHCPPFATRVLSRTPVWMAHESRAQAAAVFKHAAGEMWKYDGCWRRVVVVHEQMLSPDELARS